MFVYKAAYKHVEDGWVYAEVVDFPGALSQGVDLNDARQMLADALVAVAETHVLQGRSLPLPDPSAEPAEEMDLVEDIYFSLAAGHRLTVHSRPLAEATSLPDRAAERIAAGPGPARAAAWSGSNWKSTSAPGGANTSATATSTRSGGTRPPGRLPPSRRTAR